MSPRTVFIAVVALAAIATGAWLSLETARRPATPSFATLLPAGGPLPEFSLLDQHGMPVGRSALEGQWDLVFFGFTHCPDICPLTLQLLADVRRQLADAGGEPLPRIVFVSVDPERDTPGILAAYLAYFDDEALGMTGDLEELRKLTAGLGIWFEKTPVDGADYTVDHSAAVLVIDPEGRFSAVFSTPLEVDNLVHDLPLIMDR